MRHVDATMQPAQPGFKISISAPGELGTKGRGCPGRVPTYVGPRDFSLSTSIIIWRTEACPMKGLSFWATLSLVGPAHLLARATLHAPRPVKTFRP